MHSNGLVCGLLCCCGGVFCFFFVGECSMYKRFITSLVVLAIGMFALAHPRTASAASAVPAACERQYCVASCPSDVNAFCDAKRSPAPCPGGTGNWTVINA